MQLHASCVAISGRGILIRGRSGSGKSGLALDLLSLGAVLVSDDRTDITVEAGQLYAQAPDQIRGLIEARGLGILRAATAKRARVGLVVDLDTVETERYPPLRETELAGAVLPLLHNVEMSHFAAGIRQYVLGGRAAV